MSENLGLFPLNLSLCKFNYFYYLTTQFHVEIIHQEKYDVGSILILIKYVFTLLSPLVKTLSYLPSTFANLLS